MPHTDPRIETEHTTVIADALAEVQAKLREKLAACDMQTTKGRMQACHARAQLAITPAIMRWVAEERENDTLDAIVLHCGVEALIVGIGTLISSNVAEPLWPVMAEAAARHCAKLLPELACGTAGNGCEMVARSYRPPGRA